MAPAQALDVHARLSVLEQEAASVRTILEKMLGVHGEEVLSNLRRVDPATIFPRTQFDHPSLLTLPAPDADQADEGGNKTADNSNPVPQPSTGQQQPYPPPQGAPTQPPPAGGQGTPGH